MDNFSIILSSGMNQDNLNTIAVTTCKKSQSEENGSGAGFFYDSAGRQDPGKG